MRAVEAHVEPTSQAIEVGQYEPSGQILHSLADLAAFRVEYVPLGHSVPVLTIEQVTSPISPSLQVLPAGHKQVGLVTLFIVQAHLPVVKVTMDEPPGQYVPG